MGMDEYQKDTLIDELEKLIVTKAMEIRIKDVEIRSLKERIERLEAQAKEKEKNK